MKKSVGNHIFGELAYENIKNREEIISLLQALPMAPQIEFNEYLYFIDINKLNGRGIGFVDMHLLALNSIRSSKIVDCWQKTSNYCRQSWLNYQKEK